MAVNLSGSASVNGVVVWLGNPRGGRGESEKEWMTEGGGKQTEGSEVCHRKCFSLHSFAAATKKYTLTHSRKKVEGIPRIFFFQQNKTKHGQKKNTLTHTHTHRRNILMQWELNNTNSKAHKALRPAGQCLMLTVYSENDWWPSFTALLHHCWTKTQCWLFDNRSNPVTSDCHDTAPSVAATGAQLAHTALKITEWGRPGSSWTHPLTRCAPVVQLRRMMGVSPAAQRAWAATAKGFVLPSEHEEAQHGPAASHQYQLWPESIFTSRAPALSLF